MTTTRVYKSTDASAPVLTGQVGSFKTLIKALLVGTSGVAYGSGPTEKLAAGWSTYADSGNKLALQNSAAAGGSGMFVRFDDGGIEAGGARDCMFRIYSAMSDIDTGTNITPTTAIAANGVGIRKSSTLDATARPWQVWADERTCYVWVEAVTNAVFTTRHSHLYAFGDAEPLIPGDAYAQFISGNSTYQANNNNMANGRLALPNAPLNATPTIANPGSWFIRRYQQDTGPEAFQTSYIGTPGSAGAANPGAIGGTAALSADPMPGLSSRLYIPAYAAQTGIIRARLRGLYCPLTEVSAGSPASVLVDSAPAGLPAGSELHLVRSDVSSGNGVRGFMGIEAVLPWT